MPKKNSKKKNETSELIDALKFVSLVQKAEGTELETHCNITQGFVTGGNNILAAGTLLKDAVNVIDAALPTFRFLQILERCEESVTLVQIDHKLRIQSGTFQASLASLGTDLPVVSPDLRAGPATDALREALAIVAPVVKDSAPRLIDASILIRSGSVVGTNSKTLLEAWTGLAMPTVVIPKQFATALSRVDKTITGFGFSERSFTIWFEDNSWIRTQLFDATWPDIDTILNSSATTDVTDLPDDFFLGASKVALFGNGDVTIGNIGELTSSDKEASYMLKFLMPTAKFDGEELQRVAGFAKRYQYTAKCALFYGDSIRGAVAFLAS